jgi:hypothetical protein
MPVGFTQFLGYLRIQGGVIETQRFEYVHLHVLSYGIPETLSIRAPSRQ